MATTINARIKHKRGIESSMPSLKPGQLFLCTDTDKIYKGTESGRNVCVSDIKKLNNLIQFENIKQSTDLIVASNVQTIIPFNTISENSNIVEVTNGNIKILSSGVYLIIPNVWFYGLEINTPYSIALYNNDNNVSGNASAICTANNGYTINSFPYVIRFNENDIVTLRVTNKSSISATLAQISTVKLIKLGV